ncbi:MAG TPA: hypothetical protein DCL60_04825 [Armatimonadetes bacterium]|nr:hypothetical protein [Armatimonadota bacterium]
MSASEVPLQHAAWIWLKQNAHIPNQYACFRKKFNLSHVAENASADISADSNFILYVNGIEVACGQFSDYPEQKTFTRLLISEFLHTGDNVICILAYYRGQDSNEYRKGLPGLAFELKCDDAIIATDTTWKAVQHPAFTSGITPRVTRQMAFTACFDARLSAPWTEAGYTDDSWPSAAPAWGEDFSPEIVERPVPLLEIQPETPARLVMQGNICRGREGGSFVETMSLSYLLNLPQESVFTIPSAHKTQECASDLLRTPDDRWLTLPPADTGDGRFLILDLGREEVGLLSLHVDAPAGTVMDIAHGEHLDDGRVRMYVGGRNFADRYICREGINRFVLPFRRLGARYIEVHFTEFSRPVRINYIGLKPTILNVAETGRFQSSDRLADMEYNIARRTLRLCMHEHYEDCPWREQALYAFDSRNQALYGYYAFGNYDFAAASFNLLGRGIRDDGLLEMCAPARIPITIPIFSLVWITALAEHWLHSGSSRLFDTYSSQIEFMLKKACANPHAPTGLYATPQGEHIWNFYEWMDGLSTMSEEGRLDAPYNLFLHESLGSFAWMLEESGRDASAVHARREELGKSIFKAFWNREKKALSTYLKNGVQTHYSDLTQVLALHERILPPDAAKMAAETLQHRSLYPVTLSSTLYKLRALMQNQGARAFMDDEIHTNWGKMLVSGATSFWETIQGGDDFDGAGSLCHGWSALPAFYLGAYALGIFPLEPGFRKFLVKPYPGRLYHAEGTVPTPHGGISISWQRAEEGLSVAMEGPDSLSPVTEPLPEAPIARLTWNGRRLL